MAARRKRPSIDAATKRRMVLAVTNPVQYAHEVVRSSAQFQTPQRLQLQELRDSAPHEAAYLLGRMHLAAAEVTTAALRGKPAVIKAAIVQLRAELDYQRLQLATECNLLTRKRNG